MPHVNRGTHYRHFCNKPAPRTIQNQKIKVHILQIYSGFGKSIGAYRIQYVLGRGYGIRISAGRVCRLMDTMDLPKMSTVKPEYKASHNDGSTCKNVLDQKFNQQAPNPAWAGDPTYVKANGRNCYLCVIINLFSRKAIGWQVSPRHNSGLVINASRKAYMNRGYPQNILFHSDRGPEYTGRRPRQVMDECNVPQPFPEKGCPYGNACCESFSKQMKREELNRGTFATFGEFRLPCFKHIERYNKKRPHASLNNLAPSGVEENFFKGNL